MGDEPHTIPIGALVRLTFEPYEGVCLFIIDYRHDVGGEALYQLSAEPDLVVPPMPRQQDFEDEREFWRCREKWALKAGAVWGSIGEASFEVIRIEEGEQSDG